MTCEDAVNTDPGYANAGKSSLMRVLTGSQVLAADQPFATLDTTVRALKPEASPRVLVSDTVGFIKKLPHDLVASFRSTLAEALDASLLLLNKMDRIDEAGRSALMAKHPEVVFLSASSADDVAALRMTIIAFFESAMVEDRLTLPCAKQGLLGAVYANARVISEEVDANGRILSQRSLPGGIARLRKSLSAC